MYQCDKFGDNNSGITSMYTSDIKTYDRKLEKYGRVEKVWGVPGHVFATFNEGQDIVTINAKPLSSKYFAGDGAVEFSKKLAVFDILFMKGDPHKLILIHMNSTVELWQYNSSSYTWRIFGFCQLSSADPRKLRVNSACIHSGSLYWCESVKNDLDNCSVWWRALPAGHQDWHCDSLGSPTVIAEFCLPCDLYPASDVIVMWPRNGPPGVILKWFPSNYTIQVHVGYHGNVKSEKKCSVASDFQKLIEETTMYWVQAEPIEKWHQAVDISNNRLLCIDHKGVVREITEEEEMKELVTLDNSAAWEGNITCSIYNRNLFILTGTDIRVYSLSSGSVVQTLCVEGATVRGLWASRTSLHLAGFYTDTALYYIQLRAASEWTHKSITEATGSLSHCNKSNHATQLALQHIYETFKSSSPGSDLPIADMLTPSLLQNPALLLALLQEGEKNTDVSRDALKQLRNIVKEHKPVSTQLTSILEPLLTKYNEVAYLRERLLNEAGSQDLDTRTLLEEVESLMSGRDHLDLDLRLAQFEMLANKYPTEILTIASHLLGVEKSAFTYEVKKLWMDMLFPVSSPSPVSAQPGHMGTGSLHILKVICRLAFIQSPHQMNKFVQLAIYAFDQQTSAATFMDQKNKHYITREVLHCLPRTSQSRDLSAATMAVMWLHLASGHADREMQALRLLLNHHLWAEAIHLVKQQASAGDNHIHLYQLLLTKAMQENVFTKYNKEILELAPKDMRSEETLWKLSGSVKEAKTKGIFCTSTDADMEIGGLKVHMIAQIEQNS